ncbi:MAG: hypothetical protein ABR567_02205 [Myxococcales bacterium]|nr:hypothetical protein [Myxococcales bacterium]
MRRLLLLAATLVAATACAPTRVPVEVDWTFGGQFCDQAGVAQIQIDVDGEALTQNVWTCAEAGTGVKLGDFLSGPYTVTVTGFDSDGNVIYQTTQTIQVRNTHSTNVFTVDAAPTTGTATLQWTFGGKSCAAAGVTGVQISVDNTVITTSGGFPCSNPNDSGVLVDGSTIGPLSPGNHTFALAAHGSNGAYYASGDFVVAVTVGQDTPVAVNVPAATPTNASAEVRWTFAAGKSCADVGVDHIYVYFDPPASGSWGKPVADTACSGFGGAPVTELQIVDVPDGQHSFAIQGTRGNSLLYYTHHPVTTQFTAPFTTAVDVTAESTP